MTTDRAGPEGTIGREERETTCPHSTYWLGPDGLYVLSVLNSAGPWELVSGTELIPEAPAKPVGCLTETPDSPR